MRNTDSLDARATGLLAKSAMVLAAFTLAVVVADAPAMAQKKPVAAKTAAKAQAKKPKWDKVCRLTKVRKKGKDKKVVARELEICRIQNEFLTIDFDRNNKAFLVPIYKVVVTHVKKEKVLSLSVDIRPGMALRPGLPVAVLNKQQWDKIHKGERLDVRKEDALRLPYLVCTRTSCKAELAINDKFITRLKKGAGLLIQPIDILRGPGTIVVPLIGFTAAFESKGEDYKTYQIKRQAQLKQAAAEHRAARTARAAQAAKAGKAAADGKKKKPK